MSGRDPDVLFSKATSTKAGRPEKRSCIVGQAGREVVPWRNGNSKYDLRRADHASLTFCRVAVQMSVFATANAYYCKLLGGREVVGKPLVEAIPEMAAQPFFVDMLQEVIRSGQPYVGEQVAAMLDRGDGTMEQPRFDFVYQPLTNSDGKVNGLMIHATEATNLTSASSI
jgi:hypothetical protein